MSVFAVRQLGRGPITSIRILPARWSGTRSVTDWVRAGPCGAAIASIVRRPGGNMECDGSLAPPWAGVMGAFEAGDGRALLLPACALAGPGDAGGDDFRDEEFTFEDFGFGAVAGGVTGGWCGGAARVAVVTAGTFGIEVTVGVVTRGRVGVGTVIVRVVTVVGTVTVRVVTVVGTVGKVGVVSDTVVKGVETETVIVGKPIERADGAANAAITPQVASPSPAATQRSLRMPVTPI